MVQGQLDLVAVFSFSFLCAGDLTLNQGSAPVPSAPDKSKISRIIVDDSSTWKFSSSLGSAKVWFHLAKRPACHLLHLDIKPLPSPVSIVLLLDLPQDGGYEEES